jgi:hypothetical protein
MIFGRVPHPFHDEGTPLDAGFSGGEFLQEPAREDHLNLHRRQE